MSPPNAIPLDEPGRAALEAMRRRSPKADPLAHLPELSPARIPRHIAIIMDGNGRWARQRGLPRAVGHRSGAKAVRAVVEHCGKLGVEALTLYSFSSENWKRPAAEIEALMDLCVTYLEGEQDRLRAEGIRLRVIGDRAGLPPRVLAAIDAALDATSSNTAATLCLAINYGSRAEIAEAARRLASRAARGELDPASITEGSIARELQTLGLPDPDLLIRTAGEKRISNFLLWQASYAELYFTDALWPDFDAAELNAAIRDYASRSRRFGGLEPS